MPVAAKCLRSVVMSPKYFAAMALSIYSTKSPLEGALIAQILVTYGPYKSTYRDTETQTKN